MKADVVSQRQRAGLSADEQRGELHSDGNESCEQQTPQKTHSNNKSPLLCKQLHCCWKTTVKMADVRERSRFSTALTERWNKRLLTSHAVLTARSSGELG